MHMGEGLDDDDLDDKPCDLSMFTHHDSSLLQAEWDQWQSMTSSEKTVMTEHIFC